jgi:hypothetical protein
MDEQGSGWADFIRQSQHARSFVKKNIELNHNNIKSIREHKSTVRICYLNDLLERNGLFADAYDYVGNLYPSVDVKGASVYYSPPSVLYNFGFSGAGGFYDIQSRIIVITDCVDSYKEHKAQFTLDEVLCHELIHYAAMFKQAQSKRELEEEIAYGHSIKYLQVNKKHADDFIIRKNLFPYLVTVVDKSKVYQKVLKSLYSDEALSKLSEDSLNLMVQKHHANIQKGIDEEAYSLGLHMIKIYGINKQEDSEIKQSRMIIDVDDEL